MTDIKNLPSLDEIAATITAIAQIVNLDIWPSLTPRDEIMQQTENFLRNRGVPEKRLRSLWRRSDTKTHDDVHECTSDRLVSSS